MSDEMPDKEIPELRSLAREASASASLEDRVVAELRAQGLLKSDEHSKDSPYRWVAAVAAGVLLFAAGWFARPPRSTPERVTQTEVGQEFLLLLRGGSMEQPSAAREAELVREYAAWGRSLHRDGKLVSAEKLQDEMLFLAADPSDSATVRQTRISIGTPATTQGFFLIRVADLEEALRVARECPHLRHGGTIEVRPIAPT